MCRANDIRVEVVYMWRASSKSSILFVVNGNMIYTTYSEVCMIVLLVVLCVVTGIVFNIQGLLNVIMDPLLINAIELAVLLIDLVVLLLAVKIASKNKIKDKPLSQPMMFTTRAKVVGLIQWNTYIKDDGSRGNLYYLQIEYVDRFSSTKDNEVKVTDKSLMPYFDTDAEELLHRCENGGFVEVEVLGSSITLLDVYGKPARVVDGTPDIVDASSYSDEYVLPIGRTDRTDALSSARFDRMLSLVLHGIGLVILAIAAIYMINYPTAKVDDKAFFVGIIICVFVCVFISFLFSYSKHGHRCKCLEYGRDADAKIIYFRAKMEWSSFNRSRFSNASYMVKYAYMNEYNQEVVAKDIVSDLEVKRILDKLKYVPIKVYGTHSAINKDRFRSDVRY